MALIDTTYLDSDFDHVSGARPALLSAVNKLNYSTVYARDHDAVGDGVTDDTAALQAALSTGKLVRLSAGDIHLISATLVVPITGGGIIADLDAAIVLSNAAFTNSAKATRYGTTGCGILVSGLTSGLYTQAAGAVVQGVKMRMQTAVNGRIIVPIAARNAKDVRINGNDLTLFGSGSLICMDSIVGNSSACFNYLHDCTENGAAFVDTTTQLTGIEVDQSRVNNMPSDGLSIDYNKIKSLTFGATALAAYDYQTDGININGAGSKRHHIGGNIISFVGEGIDHFGAESVISNNVVTDTYLFGIKLIHNATYNHIVGNDVRRFGIAGIVLNSAPSGGASNNIVSGNHVADGTPTAGQIASEDTACIKTYDGSSGGYLQPANNSIVNNHMDPGTSGCEYAFYRGSYGNGNVVCGNRAVRAGTVGWYGDRGQETGNVFGFTDALPTAVAMYLTASQTISAGATTKVAFDSVSLDNRGEAVAGSNRIQVQSAGRYKVAYRIRTGGAVAPTEYIVRLRKNGSGFLSFTHFVSTTAAFTFMASDVVQLNAGDYLEVWMVNPSASGLAITTTSEHGSFNLTQV